MVCAEMCALLQSGVARGYDARMVVPEKERAVAAEIVDVLIAVHVPFARALGVVDIDAVGLHVAGIVGDPARQELLGLGCETRRFWRPLSIGRDDLGVGEGIGHGQSAPGDAPHASISQAAVLSPCARRGPACTPPRRAAMMPVGTGSCGSRITHRQRRTRRRSSTANLAGGSGASRRR